MLTTTLALSLGLLAEPAPAPAPSFPLDAAGTSRDFTKPPPGTPADQALWRAAYDVNNDLVIVQYSSAKAQQRAKENQYMERLRDPAGRGKLPADAAEALATRLFKTWTANLDVMTSQWPVSKVRVCRYELMNLEGVMLGDASPAKEAQLADSRRALQDCVGKAGRVLDAARKTTAELEAAVAEADRAIGPPRAEAAATSAAPAPASAEP